jgi:acyl transferase domain-containing protein
MAENMTEYHHRYPERLQDICYTLALRRETLSHRSFVVLGGDSPGQVAPPLRADTQPPQLVMVFTGQGAQWPQMGLDLLLNDVEFRADISTMNAILQNLRNPPSWSLEGKENHAFLEKLMPYLC